MSGVTRVSEHDSYYSHNLISRLVQYSNDKTQSDCWMVQPSSGIQKHNQFWRLRDTNTVGIWNPTIWNLDFLKVRFQMVWFSDGQAMVPTIWKPDHSKFRYVCPDFNCFLTKRLPFVRILNGWASGFQIPFEIRTICKPNFFSTIQSPDYFRANMQRV